MEGPIQIARAVDQDEFASAHGKLKTPDQGFDVASVGLLVASGVGALSGAGAADAGGTGAVGAGVVGAGVVGAGVVGAGVVGAGVVGAGAAGARGLGTDFLCLGASGSTSGPF